MSDDEIEETTIFKGIKGFYKLYDSNLQKFVFVPIL